LLEAPLKVRKRFEQVQVLWADYVLQNRTVEAIICPDIKKRRKPHLDASKQSCFHVKRILVRDRQTYYPVSKRYPFPAASPATE
jgi:hypothetical protein